MGNWQDALQTYQQNIQESEAGGNTMGVVASLHQYSVTLRIQGHLQAAQATVQGALAQAEAQQISGLPAIGTLLVSLAEIEYEQNKLSRAEASLKSGAERVRQSGYLDIQKSAAVLNARILAAQGDLPQAILRLQESLEVMRHAGMNLAIRELRAYLAYYQVLLGSADAARWAQEFSLPLTHNPGLTQGVVLFLLARVWLHTGNLAGAEGLLRQLEDYAHKDKSLRRRAEAQLLRALVAFQQGKQPAAFDLLEESLQNGAAHGFLRLYLDEGAPLQDLLSMYLKI